MAMEAEVGFSATATGGGRPETGPGDMGHVTAEFQGSPAEAWVLDVSLQHWAEGCFGHQRVSACCSSPRKHGGLQAPAPPESDDAWHLHRS